MLGIKERNFRIHPQISLEQLIPEKHFYRQLESKLDLSFIRDLGFCCKKIVGAIMLTALLFTLRFKTLTALG